MAEKYEIVYSNRAKKDLDRILHYLLTNYGHVTATNNYRKLVDSLNLIGKMPTVRPVYFTEDGIEFRSITTNKTYRTVYTVYEDDRQVILITIVNVKMSADRIKERLEEE